MPKVKTFLNRTRSRFNALCVAADPILSKLVGVSTLIERPVYSGILSLPGDILRLILQRFGKVAMRSVCKRFRDLIELSPEQVGIMKFAFFYATVLRRAIDDALWISDKELLPVLRKALQESKPTSVADLVRITDATLGLQLNGEQLELWLCPLADRGRCVYEIRIKALFVRRHMMEFNDLLNCFRSPLPSWRGMADTLEADYSHLLRDAATRHVDWNAGTSLIRDFLLDVLGAFVRMPFTGWEYC